MQKIEIIVFFINVAMFYFIFFYYPKIVYQQQISNRLSYLKHYKVFNWEENEEIDKSTIFNTFLHHLLSVFKRTSAAEMVDLQYQLHRSGWHSKKSVAIFLLMKVIFSIFLSLCAFFIATSQGYYLNSLNFFLTMVICVAGGFQLPNYVLNFFIKSRRKILERGVPDMIDILVICTDAGLGLDATLDRVARELKSINKPLSEELSLTVLELSFSADRRHALNNLNQRLNIKAISIITSIFIQSEQYGTTLAQTLKASSQEIRQERVMAAEAKAARLPAILTLPLILFILPCLFIILLTPLILQLSAS